jgi:hypothetical protein
MKTCKSLSFLVMLIGFLLTSCTYQYSTVDSSLPKNDYGEILAENDTVLVKYQFFGNGGSIRMQIHNKLSVPLFVNWMQSSIVIDGRTVPYWRNDFKVRATGDGTLTQTGNIPNSTTITSEINGTISGLEPIQFIAPHSYLELSGNSLDAKSINFATDNSLKGRIKIGPFSYYSRSRSYTRENSPLVFRNYLTFSTKSDFKEIFAFDNEFWVNEISQNMAEPGLLNKYDLRHDRFYKVIY